MSLKQSAVIVNDSDSKTALCKRATECSPSVLEIQIMSTEKQHPVESKRCQINRTFSNQGIGHEVVEELLTCEEMEDQCKK